jgi:predicted nucleic-acid-binding protein
VIGVDTNVLVRYLVEDDKRQSEKVSAWVRDMRQRGETLGLNHIVLCELVWVFESGYDFPKTSILQTLERLLETKQFHIDRKDDVWTALEEYRQGKGDFADYLISRSNHTMGCQYTVTFDQDLKGAKSFHLL